MTARPAGPEDLDAIAAIDDAFRAAGAPAWSLMSRTTFETLVGDGMVQVSVLDGEVVGYLAWSLLWGFPFIDFARMRGEYRDRGLGTELLHAAEDDIRARGYRMLWSSTQEPRALRWHERNGFRRVGATQWIFGNMPETWLMKELDDREAS